MPRLTLLALILASWTAAGSLKAADDPRALIERAIGAVGGRDVLKQKVAVKLKIKGTLQAGGDLSVPIEAEDLTQPGGRSRMTLGFEVGGMKQQMVIVLDGKKSWRSTEGAVTDFTPEEVQDLESSSYRDRVMGLVELPEDKAFTLAPLAEIKVAGRPALGVKVSHKGQPDMSLYFDKESGLLVKSSYRGKQLGLGNEVLHETVVGDYRDPDLGAAAERALKEARVETAGPALLEYLRKQAAGAGRLAKAREWVKKLGDDAFTEREKAEKELVALGASAVPLLREAAKDRDAEVAARAERCLKKIGDAGGKSMADVAVRLVAVRRPAGAAAALLDLLPGADEALTAEIKAALYALAQDGKPDDVLVQALKDKDPAKRAAAEAALGKDGGAYLKEPRRRLYTRLPKQAMKTTTYVDGKVQLEAETVELEFFNQFADKNFAKP
jgi:hypothetical protein